MRYHGQFNEVVHLLFESDRTCNALISRGFSDTQSARRGLDQVPVCRFHAVENWKSNYISSYRG